MSNRRRVDQTVSVFAAVIMLSVTGCSNSGETDSLPVESPEQSTTTATVATAAPQTTSTEPPPPESDLADLEILWGKLWDASGLVPEERAGAVAELGDAIHPVVAEGIQNMVIETTERQVSTYPVFSTADDGSIEIRDCIIYDPFIFESATHIHSGRAISDGNGDWIIEAITRETRGCVPAQLQTEILEDYAEYWEAQMEFTNPADPDHPGVERTLTGEQRRIIRERLLEAQVQGRYVIFDVVGFHPEVSNVFSSAVAEIRDCIELGADGGFFEGDGQLVGGGGGDDPSRRDLYTVSMRKEGGQWKVEFVTSDIDEGCDFAPTPAGLPLISP